MSSEEMNAVKTGKPEDINFPSRIGSFDNEEIKKIITTFFIFIPKIKSMIMPAIITINI